MSDTIADFAIFGSTPLAHLLAGLLSGAHGRRVLHVGDSPSGYRLARGVDLSVAPMTRPESWSLLSETRGEALKLIGRIGSRGVWTHIDPIFFAKAPDAVEALAHMRHMAAGFGVAAEPIAPSLLGGGRSGSVLRDALRLNRPVLEEGMDRWLVQCNVVRAIPEHVSIGLDGHAEIRTDAETLRARQAILADDEAIMSWLPLRQWPILLRRVACASILTTTTQPLAAPLMADLDSGMVLQQQPEGGVAAFGPGDLARLAARLQSFLGRDRQVEQAGQTGYTVLGTTDGAPAVGRVGNGGADVIAGLGSIGAFLAPALARWLVGSASPSEADWFAARLVTRTGKDRCVADFSWDQQGLVA